MKKIPYSQLVIELDKLFFGNTLAQDRAETIDALLEACGWNWDMVLEEMAREETDTIQCQVRN